MIDLNAFFERLSARPESTSAIAREVKISQKQAWAYKNKKVARPSVEMVTRLTAWMDQAPPRQT